MLNKKWSIDQFYPIALAVVLAVQVLFPKQIALGIVLLALVTIAMGIKKKLKFHFSKIHLAFIGLYLLYVLGMFYTLDQKEAAHTLESKMSFVIFPLLFLARPIERIDFSIPIWSYIGALLILNLEGLFGSAWCYSSTGEIACLLSSQFSPVHHPTYLAIYLLIGVGFVRYGYLYHVKGFNKWNQYLLILFFLMSYVLTMSLSAMLFLILFSAVVGFITMYKFLGMLKTVLVLVGFIGTLIFIVSRNKLLVYDVKRTSNSVANYLSDPEEYLRNGNRKLIGNEVRLILWTNSVQIIKSHPFGIGTGNTDLYMTEKLNHYKLYELAEKKYNPHNQFLQTWMEIGVQGFAVLLFLFSALAAKAVKMRNALLFVLVFSFAFNCLFESMLQRQSGIVFFTYMSFFLLLLGKNHLDKNPCCLSQANLSKHNSTSN